MSGLRESTVQGKDENRPKEVVVDLVLEGWERVQFGHGRRRNARRFRDVIVCERALNIRTARSPAQIHKDLRFKNTFRQFPFLAALCRQRVGGILPSKVTYLVYVSGVRCPVA